MNALPPACKLFEPERLRSAANHAQLARHGKRLNLYSALFALRLPEQKIGDKNRPSLMDLQLRNPGSTAIATRL